MKTNLGRFALNLGVAAALLTGCAGSHAVNVMPSGGNASGDALPNHQIFHFTGSKQSFKVPSGVTQLTVVARGAEGGGVSGSLSYQQFFYGGIGGRVYAQIPVKPGETLYVYVGGYGSRNGGFNGGGSGGSSGSSIVGFNGGGASDVREGGNKLTNRVIVAAGGGGQGNGWSSYLDGGGGKGGGLVGGPGFSAYDNGGAGGSQTQGGAGGKAAGPNGHPGDNGSLGLGGTGGNGGATTHEGGSAGGGGGGGYYGGGGGGGVGFGGSTGPGGGGGGGSSYIEPSAIKGRTWSGWHKDWAKLHGNGQVVFSW